MNKVVLERTSSHIPSQTVSSIRKFWNLSRDTVLRLLGRPRVEEPTVEDEIKTLVQKGAEAGLFDEAEQDLVEAVFTLGDRSARSMMTPRTQIVWLDTEGPHEENYRKIAESGHSRFPVGSGTLHRVVGVVQAKDLLANALTGKPFDLESLAHEPLFLPRTVSALQVLEHFKESGKHIALIVDEFGGIEGLLTHHDVLEAIAGEIPFSEKHPEPLAVQRQDGSWLLDGMLPVQDFKRLFDREVLPGEKKDAYQTLGGFLFTQMGRVPAVSERFHWDGLYFEIVDMDGKRIDKVLVTLEQQA